MYTFFTANNIYHIVRR